MAPSKFDDLLADLVQNGQLEEDAAERIKEASAGSPLRKERDDAIRQAEEARGQAEKLRTATLKAQFAKYELQLNPKALNLPEDLDVTDDQVVKNWLVEAGAIEDTEQAEIDAELGQHETVAEASATGRTSRNTGTMTAADMEGWSTEKVISFMKQHPEKFEALKRGEEVPATA